MQEKIRTYESEKSTGERSRILELSKHFDGDPAIKGLIDEIKGPDGDFELLQGVFDTYLEKSGVTERRLLRNLLVVELNSEQWARECPQNLGADMIASVFDGYMLINSTRLRSDLERYGKDFSRVNMLHVFIHEIGHLISESHHAQYKNRSDGVTELRVSGVSQTLTRTADTSLSPEKKPATFEFVRAFDFLNEALNDDLAEEVTREYASATGFADTKQLEKYYTHVISSELKYAATRNFLAVLSNKIGEELGVDASVVKGAFRRAYLEGYNFLRDIDTDEGTPLDVLLGKDFTRDLAEIDSNSSSSVKLFLAKYKIDPILERFRDMVSDSLGYPRDA